MNKILKEYQSRLEHLLKRRCELYDKRESEGFQQPTNIDGERERRYPEYTYEEMEWEKDMSMLGGETSGISMSLHLLEKIILESERSSE